MFREAPSGFYIYLGYLCGLGYSGHKQDKPSEHYTLHNPRYILVNTFTKYL